MLFKNVAISERSEMHSFFKSGFIAMLIGLIVSALYLSKLLMNEHSLGYISSILISFISVYIFYKCSLSPNGFLNTYLKFWWFLVNGGNKPKLRWYDKTMFVISTFFSIVGCIVATYIIILMFGFILAVL